MAPRKFSRDYGVDWNRPDDHFPWEFVDRILLQEIRDELKKLNALLTCPNFTGIPRTLKTISRKIPDRSRRRKVTQ